MNISKMVRRLAGKKRPLLPAALLAVGFCGWLCFYLLFNRTVTLPRSQAQVHTVVRGPYLETLVSRAIAIPHQSVILSSARGGKVTDIYTAPSAEVKRGDVIVRLSNYDFVLEVTSRIAAATEQINNLHNMRLLLERDSRDTRLELQKSAYNLLRLSKDVDRNRHLYDNSIIEKVTFEKLVDESEHWRKTSAILLEHHAKQSSMLPIQMREIDESVNQLMHLVDLIKEGLSQLEIVSPIDGVISSLDIKMGQQIKPGEKIALVDNLNDYYFEAYFSEFYLDNFIPPERVTARIGERQIPLVIHSVLPVVEKGKFKAMLKPVKGEKMTLKRGQSLDVEMSMALGRDALVIPTAALFSVQGRNYVYLYQRQSQQALRTPVTIKRRGRLHSEVAAGLRAGQQVMTFSGNDDLSNAPIIRLR
ncbi:darobactin export ABC transporter periplasmic adaptor subunit [Biostraticola tofi]|uniref:HlyD family secretion protein n=1 Tax=Biostraticola tofi TaxID=466109 RepID=A0A4R3YVM5_9GAMM|nr:darobactin export ABC transporter periplasmic adaptor subunit [Biostraticola tofi]TCV96640.1 HlyD family secretion protein [Biostraticola tofi]